MEDFRFCGGLVVGLLAAGIVARALAATGYDRYKMHARPSASFDAGPSPMELMFQGCRAWLILGFWCFVALWLLVLAVIVMSRV